MILDFDDSCWTFDDDDWRRSLLELLMVAKHRGQHAVLAKPRLMLGWCRQHLPLFEDYFRTRLACAQPSSNALTLRVSPSGAERVSDAPPWTLTAVAASEVVRRPLQLYLENNVSDQHFLTAAVSRFSKWCADGWLEVVMGGGSAMEADIAARSAEVVGRWRSFFLFDSDRLHPDELVPGWIPSRQDDCQGYKFECLCADIPAERWHRLERRSIENYLPAEVLRPINRRALNALVDPAVGAMAQFYNMKQGLTGDGVSPHDPNKAARAARSKGFWTGLPDSIIADLESGFGKHISNAFSKVPHNHPWSAEVIAEMQALSNALQGAM